MKSITLFSEYAAQITDSYVVDDNGIDLDQLCNKEFDKSINVDLKNPFFLDLETYKMSLLWTAAPDTL